jgi:hypothetical protein
MPCLKLITNFAGSARTRKSTSLLTKPGNHRFRSLLSSLSLILHQSQIYTSTLFLSKHRPLRLNYRSAGCRQNTTRRRLIRLVAAECAPTRRRHHHHHHRNSCCRRRPACRRPTGLPRRKRSRRVRRGRVRAGGGDGGGDGGGG